MIAFAVINITASDTAAPTDTTSKLRGRRIARISDPPRMVILNGQIPIENSGSETFFKIGSFGQSFARSHEMSFSSCSVEPPGNAGVES